MDTIPQSSTWAAKKEVYIEGWWMDLLPLLISALWTDCKMTKTDSPSSKKYKESFLVAVSSRFRPSSPRKSPYGSILPFASYLNAHRIFIYYAQLCRRPWQYCKAEHFVSSWVSPWLSSHFTVPLLPHVITYHIYYLVLLVLSVFSHWDRTKYLDDAT